MTLFSPSRRLRRCLLALPAAVLLSLLLPPLLYRVRPAKRPLVARLWPAAGRPGQVLRLTVEGDCLDKINGVLSSCPATAWHMVRPRWQDVLSLHRRRRVRVDLRFPPEARPGVYLLRLTNRAGESAPLSFRLQPPHSPAHRAPAPVAQAPAPPDPERDFPPPPDAYRETEPNDYPTPDHPFALPFKVVGRFDREGDVDSYCFRAAAGDEVGVKVTPFHGPDPHALLLLTDANGHCLAHSSAGYLGYKCPAQGVYVLRLRELNFRADPSARYLVEVGAVPVITSIYPLGVPRGGDTEVRVEGVNLGPVKSVVVRAAADAEAGSRLPVTLTSPHGPALGDKQVIVGAYPEVFARPAAGIREDNEPVTVGTLPVPGTANGRVLHPTGDLWRVVARRGEPLALEVHAQRLGTPLDSVLEVLDHTGRPVPRAVLRCVARAYTDMDMEGNFDSETPFIGLTDFAPFRFNDYLFIGSELARLRSVPNHPNDHARFYTVDGKRAALLDTTATHHDRQGVPVYKVELHPPGTTFPDNGLPVYTLTYRNDDGGPYCGKDSRLVFDPPADGAYLIRLADAYGRGGPEFAYRLTAHPLRPDFVLRPLPKELTGRRGGTVPVKVVARRIDGFNGPIEIRTEGLPAGFRAPATTIPADEDNTTLPLDAAPSATWPAGARLRLVARATVGGRVVVREATADAPQLADPGNVTVRTEGPELVIEPGRRAKLTVRIGRAKEFTDRVSLELSGMPPGVEVVGVAASGIVIPEGETRRTLVFEADPQTRAPLTHPFVVRVVHESLEGKAVVATAAVLKVVPKAR